MTSQMNSPLIDKRDAEKVMECHLESLNGGCRRTVIRQFLAELGEHGQHGTGRLLLDEASVVRWMIRDVAGRKVMSARRRLGAISRFVQALTSEGLLVVDPIAHFRSAFDCQGWINLVPALQATDPEAALAALRSNAGPPGGPLFVHLNNYVAFQKALGKQYDCDRRTLTVLDRFLREHGAASVCAVTPALIQCWFESMPGNWKTRIEKAHCAKRFFVQLIAQGVITANPVSPIIIATRRGLPRSRPPFIFTTQQVSAILAETRLLPTDGFTPWHLPTCRTIIFLLYALGLRHAEARRLV